MPIFSLQDFIKRYDNLYSEEEIASIKKYEKYNRGYANGVQFVIDELKELNSRKCFWEYYEDGWSDYWKTSCNQAHQFITGTPSENHYKYCPYCGKEIETYITE